MIFLFVLFTTSFALANETYENLRGDFIEKKDYIEQMGNVFCIPEVNNIIYQSTNITSEFNWYFEKHPDFQRCESQNQIASWFNGNYPNKYPAAVFEYPSNKINAFALPGGPIFLTTGLLKMYRKGTISNDEMAFVLAHEFTHQRAGHGFSQRSKGIIASVFLTAISIFARNSDNRWVRDGAPIAAAVIAITILSGVSQDDELYSDSIATKENIAMGYNPQAGQSLLQKIAGDPKVTGVQEIDNRCYFKTHPNIDDRVNNIEEIASQEDSTLCQYFPPSSPKQTVVTFSPPINRNQIQSLNQQTINYNTPSVPPPGSSTIISENKNVVENRNADKNNVITFLNLDNKTLSRNDILNIQLKSSFTITRLDTNVITLTGSGPVKINFDKIPLTDTIIFYSITVKDNYGRTETKFFKIKF